MTFLKTSSDNEVGKIKGMSVAPLRVHQEPIIDDGKTPLAIYTANDLGLTHLGGDVESEVWVAGKGQFSMIALAVDDTVSEDIAPLVHQAYLDLYEQTKALGFAHWLRIWQFIPAINEGNGDEERYRRFCVGRAQALSDLGLSDQRMCAATAIGCSDNTFRLYALVGHQPGRSVENPRQVSAWQYPPQYGPVSPAFARATAILADGSDEPIGLLVSGTAAVLGHASAHPNDVVAQTHEAMVNVETVIAEAMCDGNQPKMTNETYARIYVRHARDWSSVWEAVRARWPQVRVMGLLGDVCRDELLVEIEVWCPMNFHHHFLEQ